MQEPTAETLQRLKALKEVVCMKFWVLKRKDAAHVFFESTIAAIVYYKESGYACDLWEFDTKNAALTFLSNIEKLKGGAQDGARI